jgi:hypothetical protein
MSTVDLTTTEIAETTNRLANIEYYRALLRGLQMEAARCDYLFTKGSVQPTFPPTLPEELSTILQRAILRARRLFLEPLMSPQRVERDLDFEEDDATGYGMMWLQSLLAPLFAQGLWLIPGPDASVRLQAVVGEWRDTRARRREEETQSRDRIDLAPFKETSNAIPPMD